jgi:hypothetical protein
VYSWVDHKVPRKAGPMASYIETIVSIAQ